jgi:sugar/nucleoside kinase (ribokinase family)
MIVCLGDLLLDVLVRRGATVDRPVVGIDIQPGGAAANVAAWLGQQGLAAGVVGVVGEDFAGEMLLADLRQRGIIRAIACLTDKQTGILLLDQDASGAVQPHARRGANDALLAPATPAQDMLLAAADWLHVTAYAFYATASRRPVLEAMAAARRRGSQVSLDLGAPHLVRHIGEEAYLALTREAAPDVLLANEAEASLLAGPANDALEFLGTLAPLAIIKRGRAGCSVLAGATRSDWSALAAAEVEPLGAGDAFAAGLIGALQGGANLKTAIEAGLRLGAQCVGLPGGRPPRIWGSGGTQETS